MNAKEFFDKLKPWSKRKHRLLAKYLPPFSAKVATTTQNREIYCIDGFAGAAKYDDGSEGSPLLMARLAYVCAGWQNPVFLKLINVEPDKKKEGIFNSLVDATKAWTDRGVVQNIRNEFFTALPDVLNRIQNQPALFFIDPLGPTHVYFSHLKPILSRSQKITELIINFDTDGIHRIAKAAISANTNFKVAETDTELVTQIIGSSDWLQKFGNTQMTTEEGKSCLLHEYIRNIRKNGYETVAYQIRESLKKPPQYHFVYCTRHHDGIALMNDFVREEEDLLYGEHVEVNLPLFIEEASLSRAVETRRDTLSIALDFYLQNHPVVTRGQIKRDLITSNFGYFHGKDYNAVVQQFIEKENLREEAGKQRINDNHVLKYCPDF